MGERGSMMPEAGQRALVDGARVESGPGESALAVLARGVGRVASMTLGRYARGPWAALDAILLIALFAFCFGPGGPFDTTFFLTSAALPLALLGAITAYTLTHAVVPLGEQLALTRREGAGATVAGLLLAAVAARAAGGVLLALLALVFGRFGAVSLVPLLVGLAGLALQGALVVAGVVALSMPGAPRSAALVALGVLVLGLAAYDTQDTLGASIWVCRLPLLPFAAAYALGLGDIPPLAWLGVLALAPATVVGLGWLAWRWLKVGVVERG